MEIIQLLLGTILIVAVFGHSMYTYIKNKSPWQLIVLALFIIVSPVAECIKYYDGMSKLFFITNIAAVPIFTSVLIFWSGKIGEVKKCYKKNMFIYSFISMLAWICIQIYLYPETLNAYTILSSIAGFLITLIIISTMNKKKNYMEYIVK